MSSGNRKALFDARAEANEFRDLFKGCFQEWTIAGSIRRHCETVGDVKHVVIPEFDGGVNLIWLRILDLIKEENSFLFDDLPRPLRWHKYPNGTERKGEKYRGVDYKGLLHEVFCADEDNYGAILAIRTGPASYSKMLVTQLSMRGIYQQEGGYVRNKTTGVICYCPTEDVFFRLCGMGWVKPEDRIEINEEAA